MDNISKFNKYVWEQENLLLTESEFNQYQFSQNGQNPLGPGFGFASDPSLTIYGGQDSPYTDYYSRVTGFVTDLKGVIDHIYKNNKSIADQKMDYFVEDVDYYRDLKILRMLNNESNYLDVYVSYEFNEQEYFGVYKNFNKPYTKAKLNTELFKNREYGYMNEEYQLKLSNYFRKILNNWFIPNKGKWRNLKEGYLMKDDMGNRISLKSKHILEVKGYNIDENQNPYVIVDWKEKKYYINENNYFWFKWYCEFLNIK